MERCVRSMCQFCIESQCPKPFELRSPPEGKGFGRAKGKNRVTVQPLLLLRRGPRLQVPSRRGRHTKMSLLSGLKFKGGKGEKKRSGDGEEGAGEAPASKFQRTSMDWMTGPIDLLGRRPKVSGRSGGRVGRAADLGKDSQVRLSGRITFFHDGALALRTATDRRKTQRWRPRGWRQKP